jgi:hypothetical protein
MSKETLFRIDHEFSEDQILLLDKKQDNKD